jgi:hypothetical protein
MGSEIVIRPALFSDVTRVEIPIGYEMAPPETQFESEEWFSDNARAVVKGDLVIAVFGCKPIWEGVGHCFAFITHDAKKYPITLYRTAQNMLDLASDGRGYWRLQSTVETHFNRGIRYLLHLGFNIDGLMPRFGPDRTDHLMMSRMLQ